MSYLILSQNLNSIESLKNNLNESNQECLGVVDELGDISNYMDKKPGFVFCSKRLKEEFKTLYYSNKEWRNSVFILIEERGDGQFSFENFDGNKLQLASSSAAIIVDEIIENLCTPKGGKTIFNYGM